MPLDLERLQQLETEWRNLQPLQAQLEERLWLKLRLEWNYHSNHIEGNTLTYGETKAFLLHDEVSGNHTGREYAEMKGHDLAIELIRKQTATPQEITEADIRNLNQIILKEPFYKEAITLDGQPTRKLITPGRYKEQPNSVRTSTGELFEYVSPTDVPVRMAKLVEAVRNSVRKEGLEFLAALAITHHEFTLIHPFDDGNGRVARLVTNYALLKKGLLPLVIPSDKKSDYLTALRQADGGDPTLLSQFFADQLLWSLELGIRAAKGESLEEPSDIEKEIALFVREQKSGKRQILKKTALVIREFLSGSVEPLFKEFDEKTKKIGELFETRSLVLRADVPINDGPWQNGLKSVIDNLQKKLPGRCGLDLSLQGYLGGTRPFSFIHHLQIEMKDYEFLLFLNGGGNPRLYSEGLSKDIIDKLLNDYLKKLLVEIKNRANRKEL
jgi:Fic family protein